MEEKLVFDSFSAEETFEIGEKLGKQCKPGDIYCLLGDLGVGKTVFTQGFAKGLGIEFKQFIENIIETSLKENR